MDGISGGSGHSEAVARQLQTSPTIASETRCRRVDDVGLDTDEFSDVRLLPGEMFAYTLKASGTQVRSMLGLLFTWAIYPLEVYHRVRIHANAQNLCAQSQQYSSLCPCFQAQSSLRR